MVPSPFYKHISERSACPIKLSDMADSQRAHSQISGWRPCHTSNYNNVWLILIMGICSMRPWRIQRSAFAGQLVFNQRRGINEGKWINEATTCTSTPPSYFIFQEEPIAVPLPIATKLFCTALSLHMPGMLAQPLSLSASWSSFKTSPRCHYLEESILTPKVE